jgi:hypothetical protein
MVEAWFSAEIARYFSLLSLLALLACYQPLAARGRARSLVIGSYFAATAFALLLVAAGLIAWLVGQPPHVFGTLLFAGGMTAILLFYYDWKVIQTYQEAELHKSIAGDL